MKAYLVKLQYDPIMLGWHPTVHDIIQADGGSWQLFVNWGGDPSAAAMQKTFNAIALIDMATPSNLGLDAYDLGIETTKAEFTDKLKGMMVSDLTDAMKTQLTDFGFTLASTLYHTMYDVIHA